MDVQVQENPGRSRFEILVDGELVGLATYHVRDGAVVVSHSEVDPQRRGHGLASELARRTLDTLRERGERVVPACPFFAKYVAEHPEYGDLVVS